MKQENMNLSEIEGDRERTTTFLEETPRRFASEERTIDEMCNEGEMEFIKDFAGYGSDCCHVQNPLRSAFFGSKKMRKRI